MAVGQKMCTSSLTREWKITNIAGWREGGGGADDASRIRPVHFANVYFGNLPRSDPHLNRAEGDETSRTSSKADG